MENSWAQPLTLANCVFEFNHAEGASNVFNGGGAIYNDATQLAAVNCLFSENDSDSVGGAGNIKWSLDGVYLINCTFVNNQSQQKTGADLYVWNNSNLTVTNCIAWSEGGKTIDSDGGCNITVSHSCIRGGHAGRANIQTDPRFVGNSPSKFLLSKDSPCVNAGDSFAVPTDNVDLDQDGDITELIPLDLSAKPRQVGGVDIGAYESQ